MKSIERILENTLNTQQKSIGFNYDDATNIVVSQRSINGKIWKKKVTFDLKYIALHEKKTKSRNQIEKKQNVKLSTFARIFAKCSYQKVILNTQTVLFPPNFKLTGTIQETAKQRKTRSIWQSNLFVDGQFREGGEVSGKLFSIFLCSYSSSH